MSSYYRNFSSYCKDHYGRKLYRIALDAGMSCPNRDGRIGHGGCIFCDAGGSGDFAVPYHGQKMRREDFSWFHNDAVPDGDFIAYFQAYTNTYAPVEHLRTLFTAALNDPMFAGIAIATRPDCMDLPVMELLSELKARYPDQLLWIELGLQTIHESSAQLIRRGYPLSVFTACADELRSRNIPFLVHVILGLPGETEEMMYETVRYVNHIHASGIKLQLLHVLKGTELSALYASGAVQTLTFEQYVTIVTNCIGYLSPEIVIHRLPGDGNKEILEAPLWSCDKRRVLNAISHELKVRGITQGCLKKEREANGTTGTTQKAPQGTGADLI